MQYSKFQLDQILANSETLSLSYFHGVTYPVLFQLRNPKIGILKKAFIHMESSPTKEVIKFLV